MHLVTKFVAFLRFRIPLQRTLDSLHTCPESPVTQLFPDHPDTCPTTDSSNHWDPKATPYPIVRRDLSSSDIFQSKQNGPVTVPDPYRWLEEPSKQSTETQQFINRQQAFTKDYLSKYSHRDLLHRTLTKSMDYGSISSPSLKPDGYYYFYFNSGLQSQSIFYRIKKGEEEEAFKRATDPKNPVGELFFDPNLLSIDSTSALAFSAISESGTYMAYGVSRLGSDTHTIYVRRTDCPHKKTAADGGKRGEDPGRMKDVVENVKIGGVNWMKDDSGFFYTRFPDKQPPPTGTGTNQQGGGEADTGRDTKLYFHRLGEPQTKDLLIVMDPANPSYLWEAEVSDDGKYLILESCRETDPSNRLWVADLTSQPLSSEMKWQKIVNEFSNNYLLVTNDDSQMYFLTNKDAPKYKVVTYDLNKPEEGFKDFVPEDPHAVLRGFHPINNNMVILTYSRDVKDEIYLHEIKSGKRIKRIGEELIGTIDDFTGRRKDDEFFLQVTSFLSPGTIYRRELVEFRKTQISGLNSDDFVSKQVFYKSKDGTKVPMFIVHRKDFKQDGTAPAIQNGYGGYSVSMSPFFSPALMSFVAHYGGVLAVPNIRGGGEYGESWHLAGCFEKKQNVFDDFQYATKYLIANRYVAPDKVTIMGGSNGGLLVAACVNQAPELYGAAVAEGGVFDMLRFQRFTIGRTWISEFGDPEDPDAFDYLIKYSPLHNINPDAKYPALMFLTSDQDDRVVPLHSFKYAAAVQHALPMNKQPCVFIALSLDLELKEYKEYGRKRLDRT
ncbi:hypothetical protein PtB15_9B615 [Puccinia triticina]|nr:hypothetical protein PtB15_9B615 [Puccinia triticina]